MVKRIDTGRYKAVGGHVVTNTASLSSGKWVVGVRVDDGASDDVCLTPRSARALARALDAYATRCDLLNTRKARPR